MNIMLINIEVKTCQVQLHKNRAYLKLFWKQFLVTETRIMNVSLRMYNRRGFSPHID